MSDAPKKPEKPDKDYPSADIEERNTMGTLFIICNVILLGLVFMYLLIFGIDY